MRASPLLYRYSLNSSKVTGTVRLAGRVADPTTSLNNIDEANITRKEDSNV